MNDFPIKAEDVGDGSSITKEALDLYLSQRVRASVRAVVHHIMKHVKSKASEGRFRHHGMAFIYLDRQECNYLTALFKEAGYHACITPAWGQAGIAISIRWDKEVIAPPWHYFLRLN